MRLPDSITIGANDLFPEMEGTRFDVRYSAPLRGRLWLGFALIRLGARILGVRLDSGPDSLADV